MLNNKMKFTTTSKDSDKVKNLKHCYRPTSLRLLVKDDVK